MRSAAHVLWLAGGVWLALVYGAHLRAQSSATVGAPRLAPATTVADPNMVGSAACERCHQAEHAQWARSLHVQMTKPVAEARLQGDFDEAQLEEEGRRYRFSRRNGQPVMHISLGEQPEQSFTVDVTLGVKRYQGYLSRLPDGRMYVLPAFWHVEHRRWVDWREITPIPEAAHELRQIWNVNCFNCHATNLAQGFDPSTRTYATTWSESGIGCEACHGPGRDHVAQMTAWERDPANKPAFGSIYSEPIGTVRQGFDTCAYCHGNKKNLFAGFRAGDLYEDYALPFLPSDPIPANDPQGEFWPDGRPSRFNRPQALMLSGCFKAGAATCTSCHVAHGSEHPYSLKVDITKARDGDRLCTQCHQTGDGRQETRNGKRETGGEVLRIASRAPDSPGSLEPWTDAQIERHTFHPASSEGSRCISCHMSDANWRLLTRRRDHTFLAPVPELTARVGAPNACSTCHDDRSPEWAAAAMDRWWGDRQRRARMVTLSDTLSHAGAGDPASLPALANLAVDRTHGATLRASAVEFLHQFASGASAASEGQLRAQTGVVGGPAAPASARVRVTLTPPVVNALVGAAADPEPAVRAVAARALGIIEGNENVTAALLARLSDPARVVRAYAAEALATRGIVALPGRAGELLTTAQDEYVLGMGMFPDSAENLVSKGWMDSERGRLDAAAEALDRAIALDPAQGRPVMLKAVLAARREQFDEAARLFQRAKQLSPELPNIDRMIEAAAARAKGGR